MTPFFILVNTLVGYFLSKVNQHPVKLIHFTVNSLCSIGTGPIPNAAQKKDLKMYCNDPKLKASNIGKCS